MFAPIKNRPEGDGYGSLDWLYPMSYFDSIFINGSIDANRFIWFFNVRVYREVNDSVMQVKNIQVAFVNYLIIFESHRSILIQRHLNNYTII
ncbi:hypothetical protein C3O73_03060 [Cronobacter sakazakii]|nr:hypothetical protein C3O73_03060 [Cronobacter sakazakii]